MVRVHTSPLKMIWGVSGSTAGMCMGLHICETDHFIMQHVSSLSPSRFDAYANSLVCNINITLVSQIQDGHSHFDKDGEKEME